MSFMGNKNGLFGGDFLAVSGLLISGIFTVGCGSERFGKLLNVVSPLIGLCM